MISTLQQKHKHHCIMTEKQSDKCCRLRKSATRSLINSKISNPVDGTIIDEKNYFSRGVMVRNISLCLLIVSVSFIQTIKLLTNNVGNKNSHILSSLLKRDDNHRFQTLRGLSKGTERESIRNSFNDDMNQLYNNTGTKSEEIGVLQNNSTVLKYTDKVKNDNNGIMQDETVKDNDGIKEVLEKKQKQEETKPDEQNHFPLEEDNEVRQDQVIHTYQNVAIDKNQYSLNIPKKFAKDHEIFAIDSILRRPFPRWETDDEKSPPSNKVSIMDSILDFVNQEGEYFRTFSGNEEDIFFFGRRNPIHTADHIQTDVPNWWFPEALYIIDSNQIYTSQLTKRISDTGTSAIRFKYDPTEKLMQKGLQILHDDPEEQARTRWSRLYQLLVEKKGSFPFLAHYSDYIGCNHHNWKDKTQSIPLFTVAADLHCNHTFPFPTDKLFFNARESSNGWKNKMMASASQYPRFSDKKSQVVWRGSLTGRMPEEVSERGTRWHLTKLVHSETLHQADRDLFDVKLTFIPKFSQFDYIREDELGGVGRDHEMKMDDFQNYKAILDVDGHSWSSRYASLLCFNSVVLKVEPKYVDYFYYPAAQDEHTLKPWKHYIPVKSDLSDLIDKSAYAVNLDNEEHVQSIIQNANEWCQHKLTKDSIGRDVLDIWEKYVDVLDKSENMKNPSTTVTSSSNNIVGWERQWNEIKQDILNGPLVMVSFQ